MEKLLCPEALERVRATLSRACDDWGHLSAVGGDGPIREFEDALNDVTGGRYTIACSNATSALLMALMASGVGRGDEVILPAYTWPQTLSPVLLTGATPIFADIDKNTVTVSLSSIRRLMTKRTRAILAVHIFGIPADIEAIEELARQRGCVTIYDAAQGFGALYDNRPIGSFGNFVAFSFGRGKLLSVGEGGALICNGREGYERAIAFSQHPLRMHRQIDDDGMRGGIDGVSMNFRMHPLVASLALGQLEGMVHAEILKDLREKYLNLREKLKNEGMEKSLPAVPRKATPSGAAIPLIVSKEEGTPVVNAAIGRLGYETYTAGVQTPLHMTHTVQDGTWLCQRGLRRKRMAIDGMHRKGQCTNTEKRCAIPQLFVKMDNIKTKNCVFDIEQQQTN